MSAKPHLKIVDGVPVPAEKVAPAIASAQAKFGRKFAHQAGTNFLRQAEPVLNRWARRADYFNLSPNQERPARCSLHFKDMK